MIWHSETSVKKEISTTNMLAVSVLPILKWIREELRILNSGIRKMMHARRSVQPRSSVQQVYFARQQGGRGEFGKAYDVLNSVDPQLRAAWTHEMAAVGAFLFEASQRAANKLPA